MVKKVAVVCGLGIGDALIMMIASHHFQKAGYEVTTFSRHLASFGPWLGQFSFANLPEVDDFEKFFSAFDIIILQNENSHRAKKLVELKSKGRIKSLINFYNNYRPQKHPPLDPLHDFAFDESQPMAEGVIKALKKLLPLSTITKEMGMTAPPGLVYKRYPKRIVIHPTSSLPRKNWRPKKFVALARKLMMRGYQPVFAVSKGERPDWLFAQEEGFDVPLLLNLSDLAKLLYESGYFIGNDSGPGHLASYLQIPPLILASVTQSISHWRPGWLEGKIVFPPSWTPNIKGLRLRDNGWQFFLSVQRVLHAFDQVSS